jgi:transmembrane sensor
LNLDNPYRDSLEAEAARWLARRAEGFTAEESVEFDRWWRADPQRAAAVARAEAAEDRLRGLVAFRADPAFRALLPTSAPIEGSPRRAQWLPWAIAASLAAILAVTQLPRTPPPRGSVFSTAEHGYQRLLLAGSVVQLNAQTQLRVDPKGALELERGEASFTVPPGSREMRVAVGSLNVVAKSGAFAVRRDRETVALLVLAGTAELSKGAQAGRQVAAGERLVVQAADLAQARIVAIRPEQAQELLAWQAPRVALADTRLADAIEQFNVHSWVQLELRDEALGELRISGVFRADVPDDFLRHLAATHRVVSQRVRNPASSDPAGPGTILIQLRAAP